MTYPDRPIDFKVVQMTSRILHMSLKELDTPRGRMFVEMINGYVNTIAQERGVDPLVILQEADSLQEEIQTRVNAAIEAEENKLIAVAAEMQKPR